MPRGWVRCLVLGSLFASILRPNRPWVVITREAIRVGRGLRKRRVQPEQVTEVYTTLMPKGEDFQEVLAVEFLSEKGEEVLVLDPEEGFDIPSAIESLKEMLGRRWEDVYVGHKHLSKVRGFP